MFLRRGISHQKCLVAIMDPKCPSKRIFSITTTKFLIQNQSLPHQLPPRVSRYVCLCGCAHLRSNSAGDPAVKVRPKSDPRVYKGFQGYGYGFSGFEVILETQIGFTPTKAKSTFR